MRSNRLSEDDFKRMLAHYDEAISRLEKLQLLYGEDDLDTVIIPALKERRRNLPNLLGFNEK